jgi:hypothetical protein
MTNPLAMVEDPIVPKLMRDWVGRIVRTKRELRTSAQTVPAGTLCEVTYNRSGLTLTTTPCGHCGVSVRVRGVSLSSVTLMKPAPSRAASLRRQVEVDGE